MNIHGGLLRCSTLFLLCLIFTLTTFANAAAIDQKRMDRDLDIMEAVLSRLLEESGDSHLSLEDAGVRGIYASGYGVLFLVDGEGIMGGGSHKLRVVVKHKQGGVSYKTVDPDSKEEEEAQEESILDEYRGPLVEFLGTYADAIGQLHGSDKITVLLIPGSSSPHGVNIFSSLPDVDALIKGIHMDKDSIRVRIKATLDSALSGIPDVAELHEMIKHSRADRHEILDEVREEITEAQQEAREEVAEAQREVAEARREVAEANREAKGVRVRVRRAERDARDAGRAARAVVHALGSRSSLQSDIVLEATVTRSDIESFNSGKINAKAFEGKVSFEERKLGDLVPKKVKILADILDKTVEHEDQYLHFRETQTSGIYLEGLGVIYFVRPQSHTMRFFHRDSEDTDRAAASKRLVDDITEVLADYGHTLKLLKPNESIICQVDLSGRAKNAPGRLILRAPMKAIDDYRKGRLDLDAFRRKVEIVD
jgi:hypothetical protein